jgi:hypothetical protein
MLILFELMQTHHKYIFNGNILSVEFLFSDEMIVGDIGRHHTLEILLISIQDILRS